MRINWPLLTCARGKLEVVACAPAVRLLLRDRRESGIGWARARLPAMPRRGFPLTHMSRLNVEQADDVVKCFAILNVYDESATCKYEMLKTYRPHKTSMQLV